MTAAPDALPTLGLAITTVGRPALAELLRSAAASTAPPDLVAVADQSGGRLARDVDLDLDALPFVLRVVASGGGASRGRNDAVAALAGEVDLLGFPNDDSAYPPATLRAVREVFGAAAGGAGGAGGAVAAVGGSLVESGRPRFVLPAAGPLDARTVWRVIEPALFVRASAFAAVGGFDPGLGTGSAGPWQSGEGTDLLLRLLEAGQGVLARPDVTVLGPGERRGLAPSALVAKHRGYARGTGRVYRTHPYGSLVRARTLLGPWLRPARHDADLALSLRLALARSLGRAEGLAGRTLPGSRAVTWR